jgi:ribose transport system ATP-binding protein
VTAPLLSARGVSKSFDRNRVLHEADLDVAAGEIVALIGENGAGKSTFVNILSGSLAPDGGRIGWMGRDAVFRDAQAALAAGIVHIHQELSIIGALTVMENLFVGDYLAGRSGFIDRRRLAARARALLDRVGAGHIDPRREAGTLRPAEQQIVEIAKALSRDLRLLILDEPTASLTPHEAEALFALVRDLRAQGVAVIFISHRLEEVMAIADRVVVLRDGRVVANLPRAEASRERMIRDMTGRLLAVADVAAHVHDGEGRVLLEVAGLTDGRRVGPVDLTLRAGEILGVFGLVGAGRTELLELLTGARRRTAGRMRCLDADYRPRGTADAWARGIAYLPEGRKRNGIFPSRSVLENMVLAARQRGGFAIPRAEERRTGARFREALGIVAHRIDGPIRRLSGGNQQKALLARCLAAGPRILLLDEPTHGVDVRTKADLYRIVQDLAGQGLGVVFVSSELPEIKALASRIMVLAGGRVAFLGENRDLSEDEILSRAFSRAA